MQLQRQIDELNDELSSRTRRYDFLYVTVCELLDEDGMRALERAMYEYTTGAGD